MLSIHNKNDCFPFEILQSLKWNQLWAKMLRNENVKVYFNHFDWMETQKPANMESKSDFNALNVEAGK